MAGRPTKQGLDYFPMSTDFFSDLKVRKIARACGPQSTSILICLLCNIYRKDGYYILWNEDLPFDIADTVGVSEGAVKEVITKAIKVGFLDAEKFSVHGVLTSAGIQKRFFAATYRRDEIRVIPEYIIPNGDIPIFDSNNSINAGNNSISASNNSINAGNNSINAVRNSTDALGTRENRPKTGENPPTEDGFPIFTSNNSIFASNNSIFASNNSINDSSNEQSKVNKSKEKNNISPPL